jgi:hypothetical protein
VFCGKSSLVEALTKWMLRDHWQLHGLKRIPADQRKAIEARAKEIVEKSLRRKSLRALEKKGRPLALATIQPLRNPRAAGQQNLFFIYDYQAKKKVGPWLRETIGEMAVQAPRYTQIGMSLSDEKLLGERIQKSGFNTRYEVLRGDVKLALENLVRKKAPPRNLDHLGLEIKIVNSVSQIREVMRLQKRVSLQNKRHVYFSHTASQLKKDKAEYHQIICGKMNGRILGVYRGTKLLGLMVTNIHAEASASESSAGFSFFLDRSIQGKGISKTGYLLLLEYLREKRIRNFYGGTSQPAIQALGQLMKREVQKVLFVKM